MSGFAQCLSYHFHPLLTDVPPQGEHCRDEGQKVADGLANPYSVQTEIMGEYQQAWQQINELPGEGKEDTHLGHTNALEEIAYHNLRSHDGEHHHTDSHAAHGNVDELRIVGKDGDHGMRKQFADNEARSSDTCAGDDAEPQYLLHAVQLLGSEIIAHNRLHTHG